MRSTPLIVVILAAGEGTRMKSRRLAKVVHGFAGRSMLGHVLAAVAPLEAQATEVVVGARHEQVAAHLAEISPKSEAVVQAERRGTGHAVRTGLAGIPAELPATVLVVPGDAPLLRGETLATLVDEHEARGSAVTVLTSRVADPSGYGRVVRGRDDTVARIVEERDASEAERALDEVSALVFAFDHRLLREALHRLDADNDQGEEYLGDALAILAAEGHPVRAVLADAAQTAGINDRVQLAAAARVYNDRLLIAHMRAGVSVQDPASTWLDAEVTLEPDVTLLPGVELRGSTHVAAGATIGPETSLTDTTVGEDAMVTRTVAVRARIGPGASVGPFAYLRPGADLGREAHIGTYVEVKNAEIGEGTKVPHLSYIGDATIGRHTNIGAASVFVNYDGVTKRRSVVGDHARTGADTMFVAPVQVGDGAYTAAGSVITGDVPPGALARSTARQENVPGWVARKRAGTAADEAARRGGAAAEPEPSENHGPRENALDPSEDAT